MAPSIRRTRNLTRTADLSGDGGPLGTTGSPALPLAWLLLAALGAVACGEDTGLTGPKSSTTTTAGQGGEGGSTSTTTTGTGGTHTGGMGPTGGGGTDPGPDPIDVACTGDKAFEATGMAFVFPTPPTLGAALGALAYDPSTHPITIVLRADQGVVTASAADGDKFVDSPPWGAASIAVGGFSTVAPQPTALLRLIDPGDGSPIDIALENLTLSATTAASCTYATVLLDAAIPGSQGDVEIPVGNKTKKISQLAEDTGGGGSGQGGGGQGGGPSGWLVRGFFQAQTTSFDFASLEPAQ